LDSQSNNEPGSCVAGTGPLFLERVQVEGSREDAKSQRTNAKTDFVPGLCVLATLRENERLLFADDLR